MKKSALKLLSFMLRLSIAVLLGASVLASLLPNVVVATALGIESVRGCCIGKAAGHCKVALKVRRPPQEPMCGLKPTAADDTRTIIAEESKESDDSNSPHASSPSMGNTCADQCSSCAARPNQQLKQFKRAAVVRVAPSRSTSVIHFGFDLDLTIASAELDLFSPRGPPVSLS